MAHPFDKTGTSNITHFAALQLVSPRLLSIIAITLIILFHFFHHCISQQVSKTPTSKLDSAARLLQGFLGSLSYDMGLSMRVGATALASLLAASSVVNAQGFFYQDTSEACPKDEYNYQYLGCAQTTTQPFLFEIGNWDPAGDNTDASIFYDTGSTVNSTVTPSYCAETCRAHGYKYAGLWANTCSCSSALVYRTTDNSIVQIVPDANEIPCMFGSSGTLYPGCDGDPIQNCGSDTGVRVFVDPSFSNNEGLTTPQIAEDYGLLGCFKNGPFPATSGSLTNVQLPDAPACLEYCAGLGLPYASMSLNG